MIIVTAGQLKEQRAGNGVTGRVQIFGKDAGRERRIESDQSHGAEAGHRGSDELDADCARQRNARPQRHLAQIFGRLRDGLLRPPDRQQYDEQRRQIDDEGQPQRPWRILREQPRGKRGDAEPEEIRDRCDHGCACIALLGDQLGEPGGSGAGADPDAEPTQDAPDIERGDAVCEQEDQRADNGHPITATAVRRRPTWSDNRPRTSSAARLPIT